MSTAVCSTSLGKVEIILRIISIVLCVGTVAAAATALLAILSIEDLEANGNYEDGGLHKSGAIWFIFAAGLGLIFESIITILRLLEVNINVFGKVDLVLRSLLIVSLLAGGAANAYYAADNDDTYDRLKPCPDHNPHTDLEELCVDVKWLRDSEIAIAALSTSVIVAFGALAIITISTITRKN
ncbi:uncharacterized protein [Dysidea avara]|uniref:uncharacterized protein n=1 Tax=Dysidea avara TaxID=196820 RepID=UPI003319685B